MKKIIGIFVVTLFIISVIPIVSGDNSININSIFYVDDDGGKDFTKIQDAVNAASNGDTIFVYNGTYKENVIIDKSLKLIGEDKNSTIIDGEKKENVTQIKSDYVTIKGFTIENSGVKVPTPPIIAGISIMSSHNIIFDNIISNNNMGIACLSSTNNTIKNNSFINDGILFRDEYKSDWIHDIDNNTVNGKPLLYFKNKNDFTITSNAGQIILYNCDNVTISEVEIESTEWGIFLTNCDSCTIKDSTFSDIDWDCIRLKNSNGIKIISNTFSSIKVHGIRIDYSYQNIIDDNSFDGDTWVGITLMRECSRNTISNNIININSSKTILQHPSTGIWLRTYCYQNIISNNQISNCQIGLWIGRSHSNVIKGNHIKDCHIVPSQELNNFIITPIFINNDINTQSIETRGAGIYLIETGSNEIRYNTIHQNDIGIINYRSWRDNIQFNNIMDSTTGFDFIALLSLGYYPLNYWGSSITGPIMKSNRLLMLFPWSPIRISEAP